MTYKPNVNERLASLLSSQYNEYSPIPGWAVDDIRDIMRDTKEKED